LTAAAGDASSSAAATKQNVSLRFAKRSP
jgi:hypothetical protein